MIGSRYDSLLGDLSHSLSQTIRQLNLIRGYAICISRSTNVFKEPANNFSRGVNFSSIPFQQATHRGTSIREKLHHHVTRYAKRRRVQFQSTPLLKQGSMDHMTGHRDRVGALCRFFAILVGPPFILQFICGQTLVLSVLTVFIVACTVQRCAASRASHASTQ